MASGLGLFHCNPDLKRKRIYDDLDSESEQMSKRSNWSQLPFRTSPTTLHSQVLWQNCIPPFQQPLTPVDSSDDEAHGQANSSWIRKRATASLPKRLTNYRIPSVTVDVEAMDDAMDIVADSTPAVKPTSGAVLAGSYRQINLLSAPAVSLDERVPTPISSSFNLMNKAAKTSSRSTTRYTVLSPLMAEESYLPSPVRSTQMPLSPDPETAIHMEHASNGFGALSVECPDTDMMESTIHPEDRDTLQHVTKHTRVNSVRSARLHMGFRTDCEKCQQKVPGHYSHIIWD